MTPLWLILDVETTGLDPATAGVWQLGAVLWVPDREGDPELDAMEMLVRPDPKHWTEAHRAAARQLSGLTAREEDLMPLQATLPEALALFLRLIASWDQTDVIATSYNLAFEQRFIEREPAPLSLLAREAGLDFRWGPCLMAAAVRALAPERERLSLKSACKKLGIPWSDSHRALADARLAAAVGERLGVFAREE